MTELPLSAFGVIADGLDHPECVATGPDGQLYAGGEAGQVYRIDPDGPQKIADTGGFVLGIALDADSTIYACDQKRHEVVKITRDGEVSSYSETIGVPNYPVFDVEGNLFVTDSGSWDGHDGTLWRVSKEGNTQQQDIDVASFPNGLAISPDGEWLYVVLSNGPSIVRLQLVDGNAVGDAEVVVELPGTVPDGIGFLANGDLLIACYSPDTIFRFDGQKLSRFAHDPRRVTLASPTNLTFYGPELTKIAVGSLARWHVAAAEMAESGSALNYPQFNITNSIDAKQPFS